MIVQEIIQSLLILLNKFVKELLIENFNSFWNFEFLEQFWVKGICDGFPAEIFLVLIKGENQQICD